jgi:hypothetical protein
MTPNDVRLRLKQIANFGGDHEAAHAAEDDLYRDVLRAIADGLPQGKRMAQMALETQDMKFERWCA